MMKNGTIVVKVGSSVLVQQNGQLDYSRIAKLVEDLVSVMNDGYTVVLVTSGAVVAGSFNNLNLKGVPKNQIKQYHASVGQPRLMRFYSDIWMQFGHNVAQILVSRDAFANRMQYFSIRDTIRNLLSNSVIPIVNDNDILHRQEVNFSDNDHLASYLGGMLNAEKVIFLSSVDGLYKNFSNEGGRELIELVDGEFELLTEHITAYQTGTGGMHSKVNAAKLLFDLGIDSYIANGNLDGIVRNIILGNAKNTYFKAPQQKKLSGVRKWLCTGAVPKGEIVVSDIGAEVIKKNNNRGSLLARGIVEVKGKFNKEDVISVCTEEGVLLGYGISRHASEEVLSLKGKENIIVVHADYFYGFDHGYFN